MAVIPAHIMRSIGGGYDNESIAMTAMVCMLRVCVFPCFTTHQNHTHNPYTHVFPNGLPQVGTFYLWVRSLRTDNSWKWGVLTGLAYIYMVAAWGGYVFVLNMIALHAGFLVLVGRFSFNLHRAYSLFYIIGTAGAMQIPVVGWTPLKSLEQLGAFAGQS